MNQLTIRTVAQGVGGLVLLLVLYSIANQDVAAISALQQRSDASMRLAQELRRELDTLTAAHSRTERVAGDAGDALASVHADLASLDDRFGLLVRRVDQLGTALAAASTGVDRLGDRVLQAEDSLRLVRAEFADVKRDAGAGAASMAEAADKMNVRVNSIAEEVRSWDKSVDAMRADVDRLEAAFKRVQFELLNSESRGGVSAFASLTGVGLDRPASAANAANDEPNDFRPRPFGARSQPQLRSAEAEAALAARQQARQQQQQLEQQRFGDNDLDGVVDDDDDELAAAADAAAEQAAKRAALQAHGLKVITEEKERREREAAAAAAAASKNA